MSMKSNHPHHWQILLAGKKTSAAFAFVGTLDEALQEADIRESGVKFTVIRYTIIRGKRAKLPRSSRAKGGA